MKTFSATAAMLSLSMCLGGTAFAQERQHDRSARNQADRQQQGRVFRNDQRQSRRDDRRETRADHRSDRRDARSEHRADHRDARADRRSDRRDDRWDRRDQRHHNAQVRPFHGAQHYPPARTVYRDHRGARGAGPNHNFYRGGRLPTQYRSHHYVVNNWHAHRLSAPPRGYHWVQTGPDYVLAAITTGIILNVLLGG